MNSRLLTIVPCPDCEGYVQDAHGSHPGNCDFCGGTGLIGARVGE